MGRVSLCVFCQTHTPFEVEDENEIDAIINSVIDDLQHFSNLPTDEGSDTLVESDNDDAGVDDLLSGADLAPGRARDPGLMVEALHRLKMFRVQSNIPFLIVKELLT